MQSGTILEVLTPGGPIHISEIRLYHAKAVALWRQHLVAAQELLGGFSTGVGFIGSPEWAIGGALVLGALENAVASANAKKGIHKLREAQQLLEEMRLRSTWFPVSHIRNIERPARGEWEIVANGVHFIDINEEFLNVRTQAQDEIYLKFSETLSYRICR